MSVGVILGSAFSREPPAGLELETEEVETPWGVYDLARVRGAGRPAHVSFRHGRPHRLLPHRIPYRAQAWAFRAVGCEALLVTSSVGVLRPDIPLGRLLRVTDLLMTENRLPDGSACTVFQPPCPLEPGHLVLEEGLFSRALGRQLDELARAGGAPPPAGDVLFAYVGGPRGKTASENRLWGKLGADVNSMTLAPEVVLANELEIPCAAVVTGHKYSLPPGQKPARGARSGVSGDEGVRTEEDRAAGPAAESGAAVTRSLERSRTELESLVLAFLREAEPVPFGNHVYRFGSAG